MKHKIFLGAIAAFSVAMLGFGLSNPTHATGDEITCNMLQNVIYMANDGETIILGDDVVCETSIIVPAGINIRLDLGTNGISSDGEATITVEDGATLFVSGKAINTNANGTVIRNHGETYIGDLRSNQSVTNFLNNNNGNAVENDGNLTVISDNVQINGNFQNSNGTIKLAGGTYDNQYIDALTNYVVNGCEFVNNDVICNNIVITRSDQLAGPLTTDMPMGYHYTVAYNYPELAEARGYFISSSDPQIVNIQGSALEGYSITAQRKGSASMGTGHFGGGYTSQTIVYDVALNGKSILPNGAVFDQLMALDLYDEFEGATEDDYVLPVKIETQAQDIDISDDDAILAALGDGKVAGYYDVKCFVTGKNGAHLANVYSLNGEETKVSLELPDNLPAVASGYKRNFFGIHRHMNTATNEYEVSTLPVSIKDNTAEFETSKFSLFILAYVDVEDTSEKEVTVTTTATAPETGSFTGNSNNSEFNIICSIVTGILVSFLLFPKIKKLATEK